MTTAEPGVLGDLGAGRQSCHIAQPPVAPHSWRPHLAGCSSWGHLELRTHWRRNRPISLGDLKYLEQWFSALGKGSFEIKISMPKWHPRLITSKWVKPRLNQDLKKLPRHFSSSSRSLVERAVPFFFQDRKHWMECSLGRRFDHFMQRLRYLCFIQVEMSKRKLVPGLKLGRGGLSWSEKNPPTLGELLIAVYF